jgi:hypothetical protein
MPASPATRTSHRPPRRVQRALELPELAYAPDESLTRASLHSGQYRADNAGWEGARTHLVT